MQKTWRLASYIEQDGTSDCAESEAGTRLSLESQHSDFLAPPPRVSPLRASLRGRKADANHHRRA